MKISDRKQKLLTHERLVELLDYDPLTGLFVWKVHRCGKAKVGSIAGTIVKGYVLITVDGVRYQAHRLAWFWMTGEWPARILDHEDRVRSNNKWSNIRGASYSQNRQNSGVMSNNTSGVKDVHWHSSKQRWRALITVNYRDVWLGNFRKKEDAIAARRAAEMKYFGEFICAA